VTLTALMERRQGFAATGIAEFLLSTGVSARLVRPAPRHVVEAGGARLPGMIFS